MPEPTGRLARGADGTFGLILDRTFDAPVDEVWASLTDPELTATWLGPWRGTAGVGNTVELQMTFEEGESWNRVHLDECDPPIRLAVTVTVSEEIGNWELEATLRENDGRTELNFIHRLADPAVAESSGPGWEYYLDMLVAARTGEPQPDFADYYPSQVAHYTAEVRRLSTG